MSPRAAEAFCALLEDCSMVRRFLVVQGYGETTVTKRFALTIGRAKEAMGIPPDPPEAEALR